MRLMCAVCLLLITVTPLQNSSASLTFTPGKYITI